MVLTKIGASLAGGAHTINVTQTSHTFVSGDRGKAVRMNNNSGTPQYVLAIASATSTADAIGIIINVADGNNFIMALSGRITVNACIPSGAAGTVVFLSHTAAGVLTSTEPSAAGHVSKPMAVITIAGSEMIMLQQRGEVITTGAASIADDSIVEAKLDVSNGPSNGFFLQAQSGGGGLTWAAAGGAVTREGGSTDGTGGDNGAGGDYQVGSEATTNSTSAVSLLGAASMSIATDSHLRIVYVGRKTAGAGVSTGVGMTMNSTTLAEALDYSNSGYGGYVTYTTDQAENGGVTIWVGTRITNYNAMAGGYMFSKVSATGARAIDIEMRTMTNDNVMPIATVSAIGLRGISGNASVTLGADEFNIHSFSSS